MAKEGIKGHDAVMGHYKTICEIVDAMYAEVTVDLASMIEEENTVSHSPAYCGKMPMTRDSEGNEMVYRQWYQNQLYACFSAGQAILLQKQALPMVTFHRAH